MYTDDSTSGKKTTLECSRQRHEDENSEPRETERRTGVRGLADGGLALENFLSVFPTKKKIKSFRS